MTVHQLTFSWTKKTALHLSNYRHTVLGLAISVFISDCAQHPWGGTSDTNGLCQPLADRICNFCFNPDFAHQ